MGLLSSASPLSGRPARGSTRLPARLAALAVVLSGCWPLPSLGETLTWRLQMFLRGRDSWVSVEGHGLYADFSQSQAWTLRHLRFRGTELVGSYGANGSVVRVHSQGTETEPWIGTGHGGEQIKSFAVVVDGEQLVYQPGRTYSGSRVVLEKHSRLGPLEHRAEIIFGASGDRVVEKHSYTAVEDLQRRLGFLYAFMHCNHNRLNQWLAVLTGGEVVRGTLLEDDESFSLKRDVRAVVFYAPQEEMGVAYVYPEVYRGDDGFRNAIWDRKSDNKLYFRPVVPQERLKMGEPLEFQLEVIPYVAGPKDWESVGRRLAGG